MLIHTLRCYPKEVYEGVCKSGAVAGVANALRYIGFPPVSELLIMLIALTPVARSGALYEGCEKAWYRLY
ncbi:hypothetical protein B484DRAFT_393987 [Ochromonadaceae sp. CCMP2298]|nr:hypothetical protein B484DRAFT_393987 [Ochromonadaceae sp. CCMP2298]